MRIMAVAAWVVAWGLALSAPAQAQGLTFREVFAAFVKIDRTAERVFLERSVLQSSFTYDNGSYENVTGYSIQLTGESAGYASSASYSESNVEGNVNIYFRISHFSNRPAGGCVSFSEADNKLREAGWVPGDRSAASAPPIGDGEDIVAYYQKDGMTFKVSNFVHLLPILEPWDTQESIREAFDRADKQRAERLKIKPGSEAYKALCLTSAEVTFKR